jgi:hypothetical protein
LESESGSHDKTAAESLVLDLRPACEIWHPTWCDDPNRGQRCGARRLVPASDEDTPIELASVKLVATGLNKWFGAGAPPLAKTLAGAFNKHVQTTGVWDGAKKGAYVQEGTDIRSLAAVVISRPNLAFFENDYQGRKTFRAYMTDDDARYNLPVVAKNLCELNRSGGAVALNKLLPSSGNLHVRVGLARAWSDQPGKCTVMVNGVYWWNV